MEKIKIRKEIFSENKNIHFTWKDIKHLQLEDDDILGFYFVESYYSENESWDGFHKGEIIRMVEETDEQLEERKKVQEQFKEKSRQNRHEMYLKLKKEFEDSH
jgi:hypothetical protein